MPLNPDFVDGQITCPECEEKIFDRGKIGGKLRWIPSHENCAGAGARVPLEELADPKAMRERLESYKLIAAINY